MVVVRIRKSPFNVPPCATDLMLDWSGEGGHRKVQPKVLEFNWLPDCERACDYYPEFFNNVFSTLFLGETEGQHVTLL